LAATGNQQAMQTLKCKLENWVRWPQKPKESVETGMRVTRSDTLLGLIKAAGDGHVHSRYLLELDNQRDPILPAAKLGGLPLTRDIAEGDLGVKYWHAREIQRRNVPASGLESALRHAARSHAKLSGAEQVQLAPQAGEWARIRDAWPHASAMDKLITRSEMGAELTPQERQQRKAHGNGLNAQINNMASQHRHSIMQSAMENSKQNTDTIMGRGKVWNPAANR
jgi:hypothetical protein